MAKFKITQKTTVAELKEQFRNEVGGVLRIYDGRSEAAETATLVSIGAKEGELECRTSRTVGKFEEAFQEDLNLKVKVYTKDNWVKVLDGITLETASQLPNGMTKAKMEEYLSYKREETAPETAASKKTAESASDYGIVKKADVVALDLPSADGLKPKRDWSKDGYWFGYVNANEEWVIQPIYSGSNDFSENVATVEIDDDKCGYINALGEWLVTPQFEAADDFENGMAFVKQNDKWGVINLLGEWIVEPIFDKQPYFFSGDTAEASINDKVGILDKSFSWVIPPIYDSLMYSNADEYIKAKYNGKWGFLNRSLNWVVEPKFDRLGIFSEDLISAEKDGKDGFINIKGEWVIQPIFDHAQWFNDGIAEVKYKGCSLQIDTNGKINGKTPDEYLKENPCIEGWVKTMERAEKTESVSFPLHKYGDGFETEEKVRDNANAYSFFLTDNNGNFKVFRYNNWDEIQEFLDENPEYSTIYYGETCEMSEATQDIYNDDDEWPTGDRTMDEAICQAMGSDDFDNYCYPDIDFNLIYNGEVIYEGNIGD